MKKMPKKIKSILDVVTLILSIGFWSLVCFKLFQLGLLIKDSGELSETLRIPFYPVIFFVLNWGLGFNCIYFLEILEKKYMPISLALLIDWVMEQVISER